MGTFKEKNGGLPYTLSASDGVFALGLLHSLGTMALFTSNTTRSFMVYMDPYQYTNGIVMDFGVAADKESCFQVDIISYSHCNFSTYTYTGVTSTWYWAAPRNTNLHFSESLASVTFTTYSSLGTPTVLRRLFFGGRNVDNGTMIIIKPDVPYKIKLTNVSNATRYAAWNVRMFNPAKVLYHSYGWGD